MRVIGGFSKVRIILKALTESIKSLANVVLLILIYVALYASLGLNVFKGLLEQRCRTSVSPDGANLWGIDPDIQYICGSTKCPGTLTCGNGFLSEVDFDIKEIDFDGFNYGMTRFDSIGQALVSIFEILVGEGWIDIMYIVSFLPDIFSTNFKISIFTKRTNSYSKYSIGMD